MLFSKRSASVHLPSIASIVLPIRFHFHVELEFRKAEEEHLAAFTREQGEGAQWDEIARLCEAKAQQKGGKDVSRLKSLLLHLKDQHHK